jgi:hypothetical protein
MNEKIISDSILINCNQQEVWDYITTPETWSSWYVSDDLEGVIPGWQSGGVMQFSSGQKPTISELKPLEYLKFGNTYIRLTAVDASSTKVEHGHIAKGLHWEDPLLWAEFQSSYSEAIENILDRLKDLLEN